MKNNCAVQNFLSLWNQPVSGKVENISALWIHKNFATLLSSWIKWLYGLIWLYIPRNAGVSAITN